tara:strand:+ start:1087 stop:1281 length:195 start_codon:yes stop_codon:yes gene_type:complete
MVKFEVYRLDGNVIFVKSEKFPNIGKVPHFTQKRMTYSMYQMPDKDSFEHYDFLKTQLLSPYPA